MRSQDSHKSVCKDAHTSLRYPPHYGAEKETVTTIKWLSLKVAIQWTLSWSWFCAWEQGIPNSGTSDVDVCCCVVSSKWGCTVSLNSESEHEPLNLGMTCSSIIYCNKTVTWKDSLPLGYTAQLFHLKSILLDKHTLPLPGNYHNYSSTLLVGSKLYSGTPL